ncbi:MAG: PVC-type heme-binding CxxCH protein [Pirellulaceae bacterium]
MRLLLSLIALLLIPSLLHADFPELYNSEREPLVGWLAADQAAAKMDLPEGFQASVFASEPDVQNPIDMTWDTKGRLWIAENYTYAERPTRFDLNLRDRVLIFEDTDGDGKFDKRKVFTDKPQMLTSVEVGLGGVWLMCPPQLLFIPDHDGDDQPDVEPVVVLDGFTVADANYHNFANGLRWGVDGWLYGRCGASCPGLIGTPETPPHLRQTLAGGVWRYHPIDKRVEVLCSGTTNPWGHDWDEHGQGFFINTVNGHLWHLIEGAHFVRPHTIDPNPKAYMAIDQHADHWHFDTGKGWTSSRDGSASDLGGGHAHSGMIIYQGDNWPDEYRGRLMTLNFHGRRCNQEILKRVGSGYVGSHGQDILQSADPWFRGIEMSSGPDGSVYVLDWSDTGECHDSTGVHRESGRIFKLSHGEPKPMKPFDLRKSSAQELVEYQLSSNQWYVRQARMELARRHVLGETSEETLESLLAMFGEAKDPVHKLHAVWTLSVLGGVDKPLIDRLLASENEHLRVWGIRLLSQGWPLDSVLGPIVGQVREDRAAEITEETTAWLPTLVELAGNDDSGLVRLTLASTLQRLPVALRAEVAAALMSHSEDADDHNLPLMVWYGLIPVAETHPKDLVPLVAKSQWPLTRTLITRRLAEELAEDPQWIDQILAAVTPADNQRLDDIITGIETGLRGWRKAPKPQGWDKVEQRVEALGDENLLAITRKLSVLFGSGVALEEVRKLALDGGTPPEVRKTAMMTLIEARPDDLREICERMIGQRDLNIVAARGLALFGEEAIGKQLVDGYRSFRDYDHAEVISILVSRPEFAGPLLEGIARGAIPREDLSAFHARQIRSLGREELTSRVSEVWGELRDSPAEKKEAIEQWKGKLSPTALSAADRSNGRALYDNLCGKCHTLFGEGSNIGPDLTGANRDNLDYLLENVIDPSAVVNADFRMTIVRLEDGRTLNGLVAEETERTLTLQTPTERVTVPLAEVEERKRTNLSPMPEGQLDPLADEQVRDLIAYLQSQTQVPLPAEK